MELFISWVINWSGKAYIILFNQPVKHMAQSTVKYLSVFIAIAKMAVLEVCGNCAVSCKLRAAHAATCLCCSLSCLCVCAARALPCLYRSAVARLLRVNIFTVNKIILSYLFVCGAVNVCANIERALQTRIKIWICTWSAAATAAESWKLKGKRTRTLTVDVNWIWDMFGPLLSFMRDTVRVG